jgi:hypothetical protein
MTHQYRRRAVCSPMAHGEIFHINPRAFPEARNSNLPLNVNATVTDQRRECAWTEISAVTEVFRLTSHQRSQVQRKFDVGLYREFDFYT